MTWKQFLNNFKAKNLFIQKIANALIFTLLIGIIGTPYPVLGEQQQAPPSPDPCREAQKDLSQAENEMNKQCSGGCLPKAAQCIRCSSGDEECEKPNNQDTAQTIGQILSTLQEPSNPQSAVKKAERRKKVDQLRKTFKACPLASKQDVEDLREELEDLEDKKNDLEKDIKNKENDLIKLKSKSQKEDQVYKEKITNLTREMKTINEKLEQELEQVADRIKEQVLQIQQRLQELDGDTNFRKDRISTINHSLQQIRLESQESCHTLALKQVGELHLQKKRTTSGLNSLLGKGSLSTIQKFNRLVGQIQTQCTRQLELDCSRRPTNQSKQQCRQQQAKYSLIVQSYRDKKIKIQQQKRQDESAIQSNAQAKESLRNQAKELLDEAPKTAQKAAEKTSDALKQKQEDIDLVRENQRISQQEFQAQAHLLQGELQSLQRQIQENQDYISHKHVLLNLKQQHQVQGLKDDVATAIGAVEKAKNQARDVLSQCDCPEIVLEGEGEDGDDRSPQEIFRQCESAYRLLGRIFEDKDYPRRGDFLETSESEDLEPEESSIQKSVE